MQCFLGTCSQTVVFCSFGFQVRENRLLGFAISVGSLDRTSVRDTTTVPCGAKLLKCRISSFPPLHSTDQTPDVLVRRRSYFKKNGKDTGCRARCQSFVLALSEGLSWSSVNQRSQRVGFWHATMIRIAKSSPLSFFFAAIVGAARERTDAHGALVGGDRASHEQRSENVRNCYITLS